ncbi:ISWI chromatin-remodeling complex ATPase ISW2 [Colletotrichum siamense]|uniref:ISWI chromatin-remodeling complex ATPase ISW2 n=1 Tax=Colletotrichum siamense TaxID=690259 RepID=A0A9P5ENC2_COLSI|nr:ISWI chromatin-remodeling complex ATPase ISW2 [Colletotrichum siamense]KAF4855508.1 ISWI chromatin-remodeling complex ATPase ISW2 [Colletotrichum siamense]
MGYGKTLTTIMTTMRPKGMPYQGPVWIIVPKTLVPHWEEQFSCFEPVDRPSVFVWTDKDMSARELAEAKDDFIIITPQYLERPVSGMARRHSTSPIRLWQTNCVFDIECWTSLGLHFPFAIFDEVHGAKNPDAIINRASAALDARAKLLVSGTPMKNRVFDAFGILKILPGCPFATENAFLRVLSVNPKARGPPKLRLRRLAQILDACTIVCPHEALNLPDLVEHTVEAELLDETVLDIAMIAHQFHRLAVISGGGRRRRPQNTGHGAALSYATRERLMATSPIFNRPSPSQEKDMRSTRERFEEWCTEKGHDKLTIARNPDLLQVGDVDEEDEVIGPDDANLNDNPRRARNRQLWLSHLDTEWEKELDWFVEP